jgi:hypothetical protein
LADGVIRVFDMRKEKEVRVDGVPFHVATKGNHLLISFFSLFVKFLFKCEHALEYFREKHDILGDFMIMCLNEFVTRC